MDPDDIRKLSDIIRMNQSALKKVSGDDFIFHEDDSRPEELVQNPLSGKVLPFSSKKTPWSEDKPPEDSAIAVEDNSAFIDPELELWQRELSRNISESLNKIGGSRGYQKPSNMFVVKLSSDKKEEDKFRHAQTNGVLINKKSG
jgi:hypothetical protein